MHINDRSGHWRSLARLVAAALVLSVAARGAFADARENDAIASRLFNEGRVLAQQERWLEACAKFEDSQRWDPALGTSLNLARCYENVGKPGRAWQLYRKAAALAERAGNFVRRDFAQTQAEALEPRLAKVVISSGGELPSGLVITWDGRALEGTTQRTTLYDEAGPHRLIASAPGNEVFIKRVKLVAGEPQTIEIPDLLASRPREDGEPAPDPISLGDQVTALATAAIRRHITRDRITLGLGATGLVTAGVGLVFGARAGQKYDRAKALCAATRQCARVDSERRGALLDDARSDAMISTVLVGAGAAAAIATTILFVTRPAPRSRDTARIVPIRHRRGAGLALSGRF